MRYLEDPKNMAPDDLDALNEKFALARMLLARSSVQGGSPFIYVFSMMKKNYLEDISMPLYTDKDGTEHRFYTAATDGRKYYWHPNFLRQLNPKEISYVISHETYHNVFEHANVDRAGGKNKKVWNIAVDYCVNAMIEHDQIQNGQIRSDSPNDDHPIWNGNLGRPMPFAELMEAVQNAHKEIKNEKGKKAFKQKLKKKLERTGPPSPKDLRFYADYKHVLEKNPEEIYNEIMKYVSEMEQDMLDMLLDSLGSPMDHHMPSNVSKQELIQSILEAKTATKQMAGTIPAQVEDQINKLMDPTLKWQDLVKHAIKTKQMEKGRLNDWSRFKRRSVSMSLQPGKNNQDIHPFFIPKKKSDYIHWLALLDTSGSMSSDDMTYGISQLKVLDGRSQGTVVCVDAMPYWDKATNIKRMDDLPSINIVGRGGTCFAEFFEDYRHKIGDKWDLMIVLTDGGIWDIEKLRRPSCDVVWVLTNDYESFKPSFGRVAPLRKYK